MTNLNVIYDQNDAVLASQVFDKSWYFGEQDRYVVNRMVQKFAKNELDKWAMGFKSLVNSNTKRRDVVYLGTSAALLFDVYQQSHSLTYSSTKPHSYSAQLFSQRNSYLTVDSVSGLYEVAKASEKLGTQFRMYVESGIFYHVSSLEEFMAVERVMTSLSLDIINDSQASQYMKLLANTNVFVFNNKIYQLQKAKLQSQALTALVAQSQTMIVTPPPVKKI